MAHSSAPDWCRALRRDGFTARAWLTFWRLAWQRARAESSPRSRRGASTLLWIVAAAVVGMALLSLGRDLPASTLAIWGGWLGLASLWTYFHQGLIVRPDGEPYDRFLVPNGLSFMRLGLAPLVAAPTLAQLGTQPRWLGLTFLALIALTDLADGQLARRLDQRSRLGRILDPLADIALLTWLCIGLYQAGAVMPLLLALVVVRYPGALLLAMAMYFYRGLSPPASSPLGKATTASTSIILFGLAVTVLLRPSWVSAELVQLAMDALVLLLLVSIFAQGAGALRRGAQTPAGGRSEPLPTVSAPGSTSDRTRPA